MVDLKVAKQVDPKSSQIQGKIFFVTIRRWMLTNLIVEVISLSSHYVVHLKLIQCCMTIISQKNEKKLFMPIGYMLWS